MAQIPTSSGTLDAYGAADDHSAAMVAIHGNLFDGEVLDGVYRGQKPGVRLLGITNRRLIMLETTTYDDRLALTSIPLARLTSVSFLPLAQQGLDDATGLAIKVVAAIYELNCRDHQDAREAHDLLIWQLIT